MIFTGTQASTVITHKSDSKRISLTHTVLTAYTLASFPSGSVKLLQTTRHQTLNSLCTLKDDKSGRQQQFKRKHCYK